jgi:hypothetical protein
MKLKTKKQKLEAELSKIVIQKNEAVRAQQYETCARLRDRERAVMDKLKVTENKFHKFNCFKCVKNTCAEAKLEERGKMISTSISDGKMSQSVQDMLGAKFYIKDPKGYPEVWICNTCLGKEQKHWNDLHKKAHRVEKNKKKSIVGNTVCLNPNKKERGRVYRLQEPTRNSYRNFDGKYHRHCSKCPFAEGCIMCTLP